MLIKIANVVFLKLFYIFTSKDIKLIDAKIASNLRRSFRWKMEMAEVFLAMP